MSNTMVVLQWHDDWLVYIVLNDGRVYLFNTEMWYEHGHGSRWSPVMKVARERARELASKNVQSFCTLPGPWFATSPRPEAQKLIDEATAKMSDSDFQRLLRS